MELEEEFEVNLPSEEAEAVQSTAALIQLVQRHLA
jgi:acyl carrier protein